MSTQVPNARPSCSCFPLMTKQNGTHILITVLHLVPQAYYSMIASISSIPLI